MAKKVIVVGDSILDETIETTAIGLSLESPTLKVSHNKTKTDLGGAGNIAKNLVKLGCDVTFITTGEVELTGATVISLSGSPHKKSRVWSVRGDEKYKCLQINYDGSARTESDEEIVSLIKEQYDSLVISDYRKGTLSPSLIKMLVGNVSFKEVVSMSQVSDAPYDYSIFSGSDYIILNEKEFDMSGIKNMACVVTCGNRGCFYIDRETYIESKGIPVNAVDTTGAGDCFVAAFVASSDNIEKRMSQANEFAAKSTTVYGTGEA